MNEIVNKFLLAGDKFMPEMHLRQPQFVYSACGPFTKNEERIQKQFRKFIKWSQTNYLFTVSIKRNYYKSIQQLNELIIKNGYYIYELRKQQNIWTAYIEIKAYR